MAVNTLVAIEVFYLFSVRYLRVSSLTFEVVRGTRAVVIGVTIVTALQFLFTYAPFMETFFDSRPLAFWQGLLVIRVGVAVFLILEVEKFIRRRTRTGGASLLAKESAEIGLTPRLLSRAWAITMRCPCLSEVLTFQRTAPTR